MRKRDPAKRAIYARRYYLRNKAALNERNRRFQQNCWRKCIQRYGGRCVNPACCDDELAALTIDHKNDGGGAERKAVGLSSFYIKLARGALRNDLQVLCWSCNWKKRRYGPDFSQWEQKRIEFEAAA